MRAMSSTVIPGIRYRDAAAAIEFLCNAFGFTKHLVVPGENGTIAHAQLVHGNGMIMCGSARDDDYGRLVGPAEKGRPTTGGIYVVVSDPDAHFARASAAGAEIVQSLRNEDYGNRGYSARDPEGHVWNFGSYDPWHS